MRICQDYFIIPILRIKAVHCEQFHIFQNTIIIMAAGEGASNIALANRIIDNNLHQNTKKNSILIK